MILKEILAPMLHHQNILQNDVLDNIAEVDLIQSEIDAIRAKIDAITQQTSGRGRVSRRTNISIDNDRVQLLKERVNEKTGTFNEKIKILEKAENKLKKHNSSMDEWNREYPDTTVGDLIQHGKSMTQPALNYYTCFFIKKQGIPTG